MNKQPNNTSHRDISLRLFGYLFLAAIGLLAAPELSQTLGQTGSKFSEQDRLRGSVTPERAWWDVLHYHLQIEFLPEEKRIRGSNAISFRTLSAGRKMQIDLQQPLEITRVLFREQELEFTREGNVYWLQFAEELPTGLEDKIIIDYGGEPVESKNPPWSGGVTWDEDQQGNPFIATTCQGIGASIWWPNKDHGYDEPDQGVRITATVPAGLVAVANGRLTSQATENDRSTFDWVVTQPINNYCVNVNIGDYVQFSETFEGEAGPLDMQYWVLRHDLAKAQTHFKEAPRTLQAFEHWFGPYPFYEDSFKLVQVPYLGMEHQSSVTYGNGFQNGYRGSDLSSTGVGLLFDFIVVHETGHEWFGNNISMRDAADMWIHESFTNYSENLFVEFHFDEPRAQDYVIGCRDLVQNDIPIIGQYNVNNRGSGDMYYKGGNMLHTMRHILDDDEKWRKILRGLNQEFRHQTVTTQQIENYINEKSGIDYSAYFDQFLRSTKIPQLHYEVSGDQITYWYDEIVADFSYPVEFIVNGAKHRVTPGEEKQTLMTDKPVADCEVDQNFYLEIVVHENSLPSNRDDQLQH